MLPKHWGEPVGGGEVAEQLAAKTISHNSLLHILSAAGILQQLPSPVLRCPLHLPNISGIKQASSFCKRCGTVLSDSELCGCGSCCNTHLVSRWPGCYL